MNERQQERPMNYDPAILLPKVIQFGKVNNPEKIYTGTIEKDPRYMKNY